MICTWKIKARVKQGYTVAPLIRCGAAPQQNWEREVLWGFSPPTRPAEKYILVDETYFGPLHRCVDALCPAGEFMPWMPCAVLPRTMIKPVSHKEGGSQQFTAQVSTTLAAAAQPSRSKDDH